MSLFIVVCTYLCNGVCFVNCMDMVLCNVRLHKISMKQLIQQAYYLPKTLGRVKLTYGRDNTYLWEG